MQQTDRQFEKKDFTLEPLPRGTYENCSFLSCNLSNADLSAFNFIECQFSGCNLSMAKLHRTSFRDVNFIGCKMLGLHFDHCEAFLFSAVFENNVMDFCSFYQLPLKKTMFKKCSLRESDFTEAELYHASFDECDLALATFVNTNLEKADFRTAFNYALNPEQNRMKGARFSQQGLAGLLDKYQIEID